MPVHTIFAWWLVSTATVKSDANVPTSENISSYSNAKLKAEAEIDNFIVN